MKKLFQTILLICLTSIPIFAQDSGGGPQKGFVLKGGLWGLGGSVKSQFQPISFMDDILSGFGFGQLDLDWTEKKKFYLFNPIGLDWYKPIGPGSLLLSFDMRGLPVGEGVFGFNPKYEFMSFSSFGRNDLGALGFHNGDLKFRYYDFTVGYQIGVLDNKLLITPKFMIRDFTNHYKEDAFFIGNGFAGIGSRKYQAPGYASFLAANFHFHFNGVSSIFFDYTFDSFIQLPLPKIGALFDDQLKYSKTYLTNGWSSFVINGKGTQVITGNRVLFGYQHKFGALALQIGYHSETINSRYQSHFELPISVDSSGNASFDFNELLSNKLITYNNDNKTELKSLYLMLTYSM